VNNLHEILVEDYRFENFVVTCCCFKDSGA
jgi:hypothetical protein